MVDRADAIESPCVKTCLIDPPSRLCVGCLRSLDEIAGWTRMSAAERRAVIADLPSRVDLVVGSARDRGER